MWRVWTELGPCTMAGRPEDECRNRASARTLAVTTFSGGRNAYRDRTDRREPARDSGRLRGGAVRGAPCPRGAGAQGAARGHDPGKPLFRYLNVRSRDEKKPGARAGLFLFDGIDVTQAAVFHCAFTSFA